MTTVRHAIPFLALIGALNGSADAQTSSRDAATAVIAALTDALRLEQHATRVVPSPDHDWHLAPPAAASEALGKVLGVPVDTIATAVRCPWAPIDSVARGLNVSITRFTIVGNEATVGILWHCIQMRYGHPSRYESESTWRLQRAARRWVPSTRARRRVTVLPQRWRYMSVG